jgi:hypothetical protein
VKEVPIEAYNSIRKMERYYALLQHVYIIVCNKISSDTSTKVYLQIAIKVVNDSARLDNIILILLVFGAYPRITDNLVLSVTIVKRTETIRKTIKKIKTLYTR